MGHSDRVLIYRLGSIGDTLVAMPALRLVARAFPESERWVLTNFSVGAKAAPMSQVLDGTGLVHGYIEYPIGLRDPAQLVALRHRIRNLRPQVLVYLAAPRGRLRVWRDALFFRSCGIHRLIGVPHVQDLLQVRRLDNDSYEYEGARLARCVAAIGDARQDDPASFDLALTEKERATARAALAGLGDGRPLMGASVGAKVDVKDWGDANWAALLGALRAAMPGWGLVVLGSADERERADRLLEHWAGESINLCGRMSVRASAATLARCRLFVGHDSGPMHLAAAVGTTCVAIFSSRNLPGEWFPYGQKHRVLYRRIECQGCKLDVCAVRQKACINSITVDAVSAAVHGVLEMQRTDYRQDVSRMVEA